MEWMLSCSPSKAKDSLLFLKTNQLCFQIGLKLKLDY